MRGLLKKRSAVPVMFAVLAVLAGCHEIITSDDQGDSDDSGQPSLTTGDFPDVSPCSDRDTLSSDTTFLDVVGNAAQVIHIHKEYEDDDNLPAVCGLGD